MSKKATTRHTRAGAGALDRRNGKIRATEVEQTVASEDRRTGKCRVLPKMGESTSYPPTAFERWRKSLVEFTGLGLSPEDASSRDRSKGEEFARAQRQACLLWRNDLLRSSALIIRASLLVQQILCVVVPSLSRPFCHVYGQTPSTSRNYRGFFQLNMPPL